MVVGNEIPLKANSELLKSIEETVTLAPVALSEAGRLELFPTATLPKVMLVGLTTNWPVGGPVTETGVPVPERGIFKI